MTDCIFCRIASGEIPSRRIDETAACIAIHDVQPQAPTHVLPTGQMDLPEVVARAKHDLARLDEVAMRVRERFGTVKILDHPILGAFTIDEWLRFHAIHTRHHEKQIQALRRGAVEGVR